MGTNNNMHHNYKLFISHAYSRPPLVWGNQETIWPLNPATLKHTPSSRLKELALPKLDHRNKDYFT